MDCYQCILQSPTPGGYRAFTTVKPTQPLVLSAAIKCRAVSQTSGPQRSRRNVSHCTGFDSAGSSSPSGMNLSAAAFMQYLCT